MESGAGEGNNGARYDGNTAKQTPQTRQGRDFGYDGVASGEHFGAKNRTMVTYDDLEDDPGPVVVRRAAYDEAKKLEKSLKRRKVSDPAFVMAEKKMDDLRAAGKTDEAAFWKEVYDFCMTREGVAADTEIVILEEGETYNWERGKVERNS